MVLFKPYISPWRNNYISIENRPQPAHPLLSPTRTLLSTLMSVLPCRRNNFRSFLFMPISPNPQKILLQSSSIIAEHVGQSLPKMSKLRQVTSLQYNVFSIQLWWLIHLYILEWRGRPPSSSLSIWSFLLSDVYGICRPEFAKYFAKLEAQVLTKPYLNIGWHEENLSGCLPSPQYRRTISE